MSLSEELPVKRMLDNPMNTGKLELEQEVFESLRAIIYQQAGISLSDQKQSLVTARINKRLRALKLQSHREYLDFLKKDSSGQEMIQFLDVICTNTTSFFREAAHFEFYSELLQTWFAQGQRRFRIWCSASSSGEEPYTLAMVANEIIGDSDCDFKILATDLSTKVLSQAMTGSYPYEKVKGIPKYLLTKYFTRNGDIYTVNAKLKSMVMYRRLNLSTPPFPMKGPMDVVFCRNVMIYFDNTVRKRLIEDIFRLLKPGGYLMVGHSESLAGITTKYRTIQPAVYMKPK